MLTTTVEFVLLDDGNAARTADSEALAALQVAEVHDCAELLAVATAIAITINSVAAIFRMNKTPRRDSNSRSQDYGQPHRYHCFPGAYCPMGFKQIYCT